MTSKDEETGNVSKLRTLYSKIQKANSMTDSKHQQKLIGEFEDMIPKSTQAMSKYLRALTLRLGEMGIDIMHLLRGNGLQTLLRDHPGNGTLSSIPFEYMTDETIEALSKSHRGETTFIAQGIEEDFQIRRIKGKEYRIFILDAKTLQDFNSIHSDKIGEVESEMKRIMHKGANIVLHPDDAESISDLPQVVTSTPIMSLDEANEAIANERVIESPDRRRRQGHYVIQVQDSPISVMRTLDMNEVENTSTSNDIVRDIVEYEKGYLQEIKNLISKHATPRSTLWPSRSSDYGSGNGYTQHKNMRHEIELVHQTGLTDMLTDMSTDADIIEEDYRAKEYLSMQSRTVNFIVNNYKLELFFFKSILGLLINLSDLTIDVDNVSATNHQHQLEEFYGIPMVGINLFGKISDQLGLLGDNELRQIVFDKFRNLRIDENAQITSKSLIMSGKKLSRLAKELHETVDGNNKLTDEEVLTIVRNMTSPIVNYRSSRELCMLKAALIATAESSSSAASQSKYGPISKIIQKLDDMGQEILQAERFDITLNKSHQDDQDDSNVSISLFIDDDFPSAAINNVNQQKPICPIEHSYYKGFMSEGCRFKEDGCDKDHDHSRFKQLSNAEKKTLTCPKCNQLGCRRTAFKKATCEKKLHSKGKGDKGGKGKGGKGGKGNRGGSFQKDQPKKNSEELRKVQKNLNNSNRLKNEAINVLARPSVQKALRNENDASDDQDVHDIVEVDGIESDEQQEGLINAALSEDLLRSIESRIERRNKRNWKGKNGKSKNAKKSKPSKN